MSENKSLCSYPWRGACIYPTGLVKPCCYWLSANGKLNISNSNTTNDAKRRITLLASERNLNISAMLPDLQKVINDF